MHIACEEGNRDLIQLLVNAGGRVEVKNKDEKTPLNVASPDVADFVMSLVY